MPSPSTGRAADRPPTPIDPAGPSRPADIGAGAYFALFVLFSMNLLNYIDRYVFAAVAESIKDGLRLTDSKLGICAAAFIVTYTILSPLIGWAGDRYSRRRLLAFGVGLWSVATVGTTFARDFEEMCFWRGLLGVGEASYGIVAPTLLADLFPPRLRGRVMGLFYLALPLGGALGFGIGVLISGSAVGDRVAGLLVGRPDGWRTAFLVVGVPGLMAAAAGLFINDPGRGASEGHSPATKADRPGLKDYLDLFRIRSYLYNMGGMAAVTFATGAYAIWGPSFYQRVRGMDERSAGLSIGIMTAVAGLIGIGLGAWLPDRLQRRTKRAYLLWAGTAILLAVPLGTLGTLLSDRFASLATIFAAMVLLAATLGPCNTIPANVVPATQRAAGYAVNIFMIHLFGDISSPILIGVVSDWLGRPQVANSPLGRLLSTLGAEPVRVGTSMTNLTAGMLMVVPVLLLGGLLFLAGSRYLPADQEGASSLGGPSPSGPFGH